jgi:hypothetical protein
MYIGTMKSKGKRPVSQLVEIKPGVHRIVHVWPTYAVWHVSFESKLHRIRGEVVEGRFVTSYEVDQKIVDNYEPKRRTLKPDGVEIQIDFDAANEYARKKRAENRSTVDKTT